MLARIIATLGLLATSVSAASLYTIPDHAKPWGFFTNNTIFATSYNDSVTYPRYVELSNGNILATVSYSGPSTPYFPIFESKDGGATWEHISDLTDQVNGAGFAAQPALAQLPFQVGKYPKGTIIGGGNSWSNSFTRIDMYASTDGGRSWEFVSHVAEGTAPNTTNGATPVWEPLFMPYKDGKKNSVVAYYSDQRDPKHGQKLSHQVSYDLQNWGPVVNDVAYDLYEARPGMTNIAHIEPIDKWILVHERPIGNQSSYGVNYPVYYVIADTPLEFGKNVDTPLVVNNTLAPNASPYVVWSPIGGKNGTIVVSDADTGGVYTNTHGGATDKWEVHETGAGAVYSRAIQIFKNKPDHLMIYGGDTYDGLSLKYNVPFSATVVDLNKVLKAPAFGYAKLT